jgi:hypothetical protein
MTAMDVAKLVVEEQHMTPTKDILVRYLSVGAFIIASIDTLSPFAR